MHRNLGLIALFSVALAAAPVASADHHGVPHTSDFPMAEGNYTTDGDPGWVYFVIDEFMKPDIHDYFGCGIGPDGTVGCDRVPQPDQYPAMQPKTYPPAGTNQTVATPDEAGNYRFSLAPTFTREVDILPEGRQLVNGNAKCSHGLQGSMVCETGEHGFLLSYTRGDNW